jgi:Flp pilus assembly protein TadG
VRTFRGRISGALTNLRAVLQSAARLRGDTRGNILVIFAVALPLMVGTLGLAAEGGNWYQTKRALQNAADEAVVAAATNNNPSTYLLEAKAVTAQDGFTNGTANVTVTASNAATCPGGGTCYSVTITKTVPLLLMQAAGFNGNATVSGRKAELISATAYATQQTSPREYCMLALATSAPSVSAVDFLANGAPKADLGGCNIMSNASMNCNGHTLNANYADAAGTSQDCGNVQDSNMPKVTDKYAPMASNIPANTCSTYATTSITGTLALGNKTYCGGVTLTGDVTLTGANVIVIRDGPLNLNGHTLTTAVGASAVFIFTGTNSSTISHIVSGSGTLDISSPKSGTWSGTAIYTDPTLSLGVDYSAAGNTPSWNISGLVYIPHANVTFKGAVGKGTNGLACFVMVFDKITIDGTGSLFNQGSSDCAAQGLTPPSNPIGIRGRLVG